jgi:anti-sigma28 factor (negative regulator of flagellin synthesis)
LVRSAFRLGESRREGRVAELRSAVEGGRYEADPAAVSEGIVRDLLEPGPPSA